MSQTALAEACGWRWGSRIGNYEQDNPDNEPDLDALRRIAKATEVNLSWLVSEHGQMRDGGTGSEAKPPKAKVKQAAGVPVEIQESRDKNDVLALRVAMSTFARLLHSKQPKLAEGAAREMVGAVGVDFASHAYMNILVSLLLGADEMSADELHAFLHGPASSKRGRAARPTKK